MNPIYDFENANNWREVFDRTMQATLNTDPYNRYDPIQGFPLTKATPYDKHILAVLVTSQGAPSSWKFGGVLSYQFRTGVIGGDNYDSEYFSRKGIKLGIPTIVIFHKISNTFMLKYEPPKWFQNCRITVWEYFGVVSDTVSDMLETQKIDLLRLERKIDTLSRT